MKHAPAVSSMSQQIFNLELSVETVSLYLLCCALADEGKTLSPESIRGAWNGSDTALAESLKALEKRNIIRKISSDDAPQHLFKIIEDTQWIV